MNELVSIHTGYVYNGSSIKFVCGYAGLQCRHFVLWMLQTCRGHMHSCNVTDLAFRSIARICAQGQVFGR